MNTKKIIEAIKATGAEARESVYSAGLYYDGQQHGELIPCVFVSIERYAFGRYNADRIIKDAKKVIKHHRDVIYLDESHSGHEIYIIMSKEDAERIPILRNEAETFLNAFWEELHREYNQEKAIEAGHTALIAARYYNSLIPESEAIPLF